MRGLVALLDLSTSADAVSPHEDVNAAQVEQLARRMDEAQVNPAPILLMHRGPARARELLADSVAGDPDLVYTDRAGQLQRVWRITDPSRIAALSESLSDSRPVIADGHHRWAAARRLHQAHPSTAWAQTLVMLIDQDDTPLQLSAIHRVVNGLGFKQIEAALTGASELGGLSATSSGPDLIWERHANSHTALAGLGHSLVFHDGRSWANLAPRDPQAGLLVTWLHEQLLPAWGVDEARVSYHHAAADALGRAGAGMAILAPASSFDLVQSAALSGALMPRKVTSFQPKPHLGVLMRELPAG